MDKVLAHLRKHRDLYVKRLKQWVAIKSISSDPACRPFVNQMITHVQTEFNQLGAKTELKDIGTQKVYFQGKTTELSLPAVLLAELGNDPAKNTLCIYGHLDVQPAEISDGWATEPFELTIDDKGRMFGRGSSDDKGPVLAWFNVVEAFKKCEVEIPVNLKFIFEGMEESGSLGLEKLIQSEKDGFLKNVDLVCISDSRWLSRTKPCLIYGMRGMAYFAVSITCASKDLHSGVYGGAVHESMTDLFALFSTLVSTHGQILVPGINEMVAPLTDAEKKLYSRLDFSILDFQTEIGAPELTHSNKEEILMSTWRYPSLSIHGIEGAFAGAGAKTVIPGTVLGKFSIRLVPNMDVESVIKLVKNHLEKKFSELKSPNSMKITFLHGAKACLIDFEHPHFKAASEACKKVFKCYPDLTRGGGVLPVSLYFQEATNKNVLLLPIGAPDDSIHSQNEKFNESSFFGGMELFAQYFQEVGQIPKD